MRDEVQTDTPLQPFPDASVVIFSPTAAQRSHKIRLTMEIAPMTIDRVEGPSDELGQSSHMCIFKACFPRSNVETRL